MDDDLGSLGLAQQSAQVGSHSVQSPRGRRLREVFGGKCSTVVFKGRDKYNLVPSRVKDVGKIL